MYTHKTCVYLQRCYSREGCNRVVLVVSHGWVGFRFEDMCYKLFQQTPGA